MVLGTAEFNMRLQYIPKYLTSLVALTDIDHTTEELVLVHLIPTDAKWEF